MNSITTPKAEAAEIARKREIEVAKIRAAAEAQPTSKAVLSGLSWQEEMAAAKTKKKAEQAEAAKVAEAAAAAEAAKAPPKDAAGSDEDDAKARMAARKAMFGGAKATASPRGSPAAERKFGAGGKAGKAAPPPAAEEAAPAPAAASAAATEACGSYKLDMMGKLFGDCKCGFPKGAH
jgi:hypothetical protein